MKKALCGLLSLLLVFVVFFSVIPSANAATITTSINVNHSTYGGKKTTIYVKSNNTKKAKLKFSSVAGLLVKSDNKSSYKRDFVEVKVWGSNDGGKTWSKQLSKTNIKDKSSNTIPMEGYKLYRVEIWAWKTPTIGKTLGGKFNWDGVYWASTPQSCITAGSSNITKLYQ